MLIYRLYKLSWRKRASKWLRNLKINIRICKGKSNQEKFPKALEEEAKKLKEQEAELGKYEQEMQKQLLAKRQETLQPILDKVNNIIKQVATENQFTYIFDSSAGILLYAQESMDVTALVKTKLGI